MSMEDVGCGRKSLVLSLSGSRVLLGCLTKALDASEPIEFPTMFPIKRRMPLCRSEGRFGPAVAASGQ